MKSTESRATFLCALKYGLKGCALGVRAWQDLCAQP